MHKIELEMEMEKHKLNLQAEHDKMELEIKKQIEELRIKAEMDLKVEEIKLANGVKDDSTKQDTRSHSNPHTRIRVPQFRENVDDLEVWLERWELVCTMENLDKKYWATKLTEFLSGDSLKVVFSMNLDDRKCYERVKEALLLRFNYTTEGLRRRFGDYIPDKKQSFLEYSSNLQRLFNRWVKSSGIEESYTALRDLIITSKILDTVDSALYSHIIELKPTSLEALISSSINFCEAHPSMPVAKAQTTPLASACSHSVLSEDRNKNSNHKTNAGFKNNNFKGKNKFMTNKQAFENANVAKPPHQGNSFAHKPMFQKNRQNFSFNRQRKPWYGNNNFYRGNNFQGSNYRGNNYRGNHYQGNWNVNHRNGHEGNQYNSRTYSYQNHGSQSANSADISQDQNSINNASLVKTVTNESCEVCRSLYDKDSVTMLQCGHKLPTASLATNSQGNLKLDKGFVNNKPVTLLRDSGSTVLGVAQKLIDEKDISDKTIKCITFGGTVELFKLAVVHIDTPYLSGFFGAVILPAPVCDLVLGNLPDIKSPTEEEMQKWYKQHNLPIRNNYPTTDVTTRHEGRREIGKYLHKPQKQDVTLQLEQSPKPPMKNTLASEQEADASLKNCLLKVNKPSTKCKKGEVSFIKTKDIVCRLYKTDGHILKQIVLPEKYREETLRLSHDIPLSAHLAAKKTIDRVKRHFFWPGMTKQIREYCKTCQICQKMAKKGHTTKAPLQPGFLTCTPFERVSIDLVGPLPVTSKKGNRYILTLIDFATRWPEAVALSKIDSESICEALLELFARFGFPDTILSDNGPQFISGLTEQVAKTLGIKQKFCSIYHPSANGLCEKFNGVLKTLLGKITNDHPEDWDMFIQPALFALREVTQENTGFSPFELMFGCQPRGALDLYKDLILEKKETAEMKDAYSYVLELRERIITSCILAKEALERSGEKQRTLFNKKARLRKLKPNDKVLVLLPEKNNKLIISWKGPYKVVKQISLVDYLVNVNDKLKVFHINMLKSFYERPAFLESIISDVMEIDEQSSSTAVISLPDNTNKDEDIQNTIHFPSLKQKESFQDVTVSDKLSDVQKDKVKEILKDYHQVFSDIPGRTGLIEYKIVLNSSVPVRTKPYPIPFHFRKSVEEEIKEMLKMDIIEESDSEYCSPLIVVRKKDESLRLCIDFRRLNSITRVDPVPMPNTEDLLSRVADAKFFTKLDLTKGYYQVPMSKESRKYTAFATSDGLYHFKALPFGLSNAPSTFVRLMRHIFKGHKNLLHYYDDILIYSTTFEEHTSSLISVLESLRRNGLTAKPSKTEVAFDKLIFLGHRVGGGVLEPDQNNITKILSIQTPKTRKQVRQLVGLINYYHQFIKGFSELIRPLTELLKGKTNKKIIWDKRHGKVLETIKQLFSQSPILLAPDLNKPFTLSTDCSAFAIGYCLQQEKQGILHPVSYGSRRLTDSERRLSTIERELLAMAVGIVKNSKFLMGTPFLVQVDHKPIAYLQTKQVSNPKILRWLLQLQEFEFTVQAIPGAKNHIADMLSRF
ncbi:hypothetical protein BsWGS_20136 [Bradybaena similaris]